jgi:signal peptidase I
VTDGGGRRTPLTAAILGVGFIALLFGGRLFYRPFFGASESMSPTVTTKDYFLVSTFAYWNAGPEPGDVTAFRSPSHNNDAYIKRVVGLPGDHVQMIAGVLYINKKPVPKRRVADFAETGDTGEERQVRQFQETLPNGRTYLVLDRGDSEVDNTNDSLVPPNSYFVIGDNRDNSDDSRMSFGFINRSDIIGRATSIYFSGGKPVWREIR